MNNTDKARDHALRIEIRKLLKCLEKKESEIERLSIVAKERKINIDSLSAELSKLKRKLNRGKL